MPGALCASVDETNWYAFENRERGRIGMARKGVGTIRRRNAEPFGPEPHRSHEQVGPRFICTASVCCCATRIIIGAKK